MYGPKYPVSFQPIKQHVICIPRYVFTSLRRRAKTSLPQRLSTNAVVRRVLCERCRRPCMYYASVLFRDLFASMPKRKHGDFSSLQTHKLCFGSCVNSKMGFVLRCKELKHSNMKRCRENNPKASLGLHCTRDRNRQATQRNSLQEFATFQ